MNISSVGTPLVGAPTAAERKGATLKPSADKGEFDSALVKQEKIEKRPEVSSKVLPTQSKSERPEELPQKEDERTNHPILKFMDSIESELGVAPTRIVAAMGEMSEKDLMESPEDSLDSLISILQIPTADQSSFKKQYLEMVQAWEDSESSQSPASLPEGIMPLPAATNGNTPLMAMSAPQGQPDLAAKDFASSKALGAESSVKPLMDPRVNLNKSIDRLNEHFFMKGGYAKATVLEPAAPEGLANEAMVEAPAPPQGLSSQDLAALEELLPTEGEALAAPAPMLAQATEVATLGAEAGLASMIDEQATGMNQLTKESPLAGALATEGLSSESFGDESGAGSEEGAFAGDGDSSASLGALGGLGTEGPSKLGGSEFKTSMSAAGPMAQSALAADADNLSSMIEGARFIAKDGGGDMKVMLTPEGLGQVDLHVSVKDGQVTVTMAADTAEAQELLERHKDVLKAGLLEHKIQVNEIKVAQGAQMSSQDFGQSQQEQDLNQNMARQFLQDFRHQNQKGRGQF